MMSRTRVESRYRGSELRTEVLASPDELTRHRKAWLDLLERSLSNELTLSPSWLLSWWNVFGPLGRRQLRACLFWEGTRLVGLVPLLRRWYLARSGVPFERLELVGTGEPQEHEICSHYVGVIAERGHEEAVATSLARLLARGKLGRWDELRLASLDLSIPIAKRLEEALREAGLPARLVPDAGSPYIPLPASFDAYLAALPGPGRYFVRRSLRDFEAWAGDRVRFHRVETAADLARGMQVLMQLHAARWQHEGREGAFASPLFRAFHEAVMPELLARGVLDLRWMTVGDQPLAAIYNLVWQDGVQCYQSGRTMDVPKGVRPGIVLHVNAIRSAMEAGLAEYDFLAGDTQYKRQLSLATRPTGHLVVEPWGLRRAVHQGISQAFQWWKARRALPAPPPSAQTADPGER